MLIFAGDNPDDIRRRSIGLGETVLFDVDNLGPFHRRRIQEN